MTTSSRARPCQIRSDDSRRVVPAPTAYSSECYASPTRSLGSLGVRVISASGTRLTTNSPSSQAGSIAEARSIGAAPPSAPPTCRSCSRARKPASGNTQVHRGRPGALRQSYRDGPNPKERRFVNLALPCKVLSKSPVSLGSLFIKRYVVRGSGSTRWKGGGRTWTKRKRRPRRTTRQWKSR